MIAFFLSRSLPPHTEGSAELCEAIGASLRTQVRTVKSCNLCLDSYRSRWSGMAFHSFLQRRSALRKMVHLPSLRSRMTGRYLIPLCKTVFSFLPTLISLFLLRSIRLLSHLFRQKRGQTPLWPIPPAGRSRLQSPALPYTPLLPHTPPLSDDG